MRREFDFTPWSYTLASAERRFRLKKRKRDGASDACARVANEQPEPRLVVEVEEGKLETPAKPSQPNTNVKICTREILESIGAEEIRLELALYDSHDYVHTNFTSADAMISKKKYVRNYHVTFSIKFNIRGEIHTIRSSLLDGDKLIADRKIVIKLKEQGYWIPLIWCVYNNRRNVYEKAMYTRSLSMSSTKES
tara:strand:+ start:385 stop:966 length:582 start_codon:yes stop_codon:yes gene_type:complete